MVNRPDVVHQLISGVGEWRYFLDGLIVISPVRSIVFKTCRGVSEKDRITIAESSFFNTSPSPIKKSTLKNVIKLKGLADASQSVRQKKDGCLIIIKT